MKYATNQGDEGKWYWSMSDGKGYSSAGYNLSFAQCKPFCLCFWIDSMGYWEFWNSKYGHWKFIFSTLMDLKKWQYVTVDERNLPCLLYDHMLLD